jgi:MoaA/NifB/PqqE/SkfB family radical SAM enzyme
VDANVRQEWATVRPGVDHAVDAVCIAPWVSLELDPAGWVYGCCANQMYPLGRIGESRLTDVWDGPRARVLKDALRSWDLSVGCASCRWHLEHGRMDPDIDVYDRYPLPVEEPPGPVAMTFALSNRCNLACAMCTPELSSTLRHRAGLRRIESPYDDGFFADLAGFLPGLRYAKFLGGEPFLIPEHHRVWDLMAEVGGPPRIQVTTNGTIWNERVEWVLDHFAVDVTISIDGASAATYEAIRDGADFGVTSSNIDRFAEACRAKGTELRLCFCLMAQNAHELHDMLAWGDRLGAPVSVNLVSDAGLALYDLPTDDLERVAAVWRRAEGSEPLGRNAAVWATQAVELESVLQDRRRGHRSTNGQASDPEVGFLSSMASNACAGGAAAPRVLEDQRRRISAWCGGGAVAELRLSPAGAVAEVVTAHERLGLVPQIEGTALDDLVGLIEAADGRRAWATDAEEVGDGVSVRTMTLSSQRPVRGSAGSVVRWVRVCGLEADTLLVAEDRIYDRPPPTAVPVEVSCRTR